MTRRAGLIDAPTSVVQSPNLGSGAANPATVQAYDDLARAARSIGEMVQPAVDANTAKRARAAVAKGDFSHTMGLTRQDQIYEKIVDAGFMAQASMDVDRTVGELENKHLPTLNMEEFAKDNDAARTLFLQGTDERYAPALAQAWDERSLNATQRLSNIATQKAIKLADEKMTARASQLADEVSGASDPFDPKVSPRLDELQSLQNARVAAGKISQEEADASIAVIFGRMTANRVSDEAVADYTASGYSEDGYAAAMKKVDEAMQSPELALSRSERAAYFGAAKTALNSTRSEVKAREREVEAQIRQRQSEALSEFSIGIADARARTNEGYAPNLEELQDLARLAGQTRNPEKYLAQIGQIAMTGQVQQQFRSLSIPEQEQELRNTELAASQGNADAARMLDSMRKVAASSRSAAEADPATFQAVREKRDVPVVDWSTPARAAQTLASRFQQAEIAAGDLGVAPKYFSPADRTMLKAASERGGTAALDLAASIVRGASAAGADPLRVMNEISDGAPLLARAGILISQGVPSNGAPAAILTGPLSMGSELVKDKMPDTKRQAAAQRTVLGEIAPTLPQNMQDAITRSADAIFATDIVQGKGTPKGTYEGAVRQAIGEWSDGAGKKWGGLVTYKGRPTVAPPWIGQADFPTVVANLTPKDVISALSGADYGGMYKSSSLGIIRGREATIADYRSAVLVEAGDPGSGLYYIKPDAGKPDFLEYPRGQHAVLNLNAIREDLKQRSRGVQ